MDTPEADISAIQRGTMEPLPVYVEHERDDLNGLLPLLQTINEAGASLETYNLESTDLDALSRGGSWQSIDHFPEVKWPQEADEPTRIRQRVVEGFFEAIKNEQPEAIALFIDRNLVTANTTEQIGKTPLLAAVATKNVQIVKQLIDYGAEPDAFGVESRDWNRVDGGSHYTSVRRTPLQLAASIGHLPLVQLLMETYHCDDSLVAPDGQIALRLAATNGHREVVDYLPARRGGGFLRWQTQHKTAILRSKRALWKIYRFFRFFVWDIEKFVLWTCPKHIIVKPVMKVLTLGWKHRKGFGPWCKRQVRQTPVRFKKFGKCVWNGVKKVPKAIADTAEEGWKFAKKIPKILEKVGKWIYNLVTKEIPRAIAIAAKWVWSGISSGAQALSDIILKLASLIHTALEATLTFFRELTLEDIWNGIRSLLRAIFVTLPSTVWSWMKRFSDASYDILKTLFGGFGKCVWWIFTGLGFLAFWIVFYVPKMLWTVIQSMGSSFAKAWYEVLVWFKPKA